MVDVHKEIRQDLFLKWMAMPISIIIILCAGSTFNLMAEYQAMFVMRGYKREYSNTIENIALCGYYMGIIPGLLNKYTNSMLTFFIAAVLAVVSYVCIGVVAGDTNDTGSVLVVSLIALFFAALSSGIATVTAIISSVKNYTDINACLNVVVLISYLKLAQYMDLSFAQAFLTVPNPFFYYSILGVTLCLIYVIGAFVVKDVELGFSNEVLFQDYDTTGLLLFLLLETILLVLFYVFAFLMQSWYAAAFLFIAVVIVNFIPALLQINLSMKVALSGAFNSNYSSESTWEKGYYDTLPADEYWTLALSSLCVVGSCYAFEANYHEIAFAYGKVDFDQNLRENFWAADSFARIIGGLAAFFTYRKMNQYYWGIGAAIFSAIGFAIVLLTPVLGIWCLSFGSICIGLGVGIFWVAVPLILIQEEHKDKFGLNWAITLTANFIGIFIFGLGFRKIYFAKGEEVVCSGSGCVNIQLFVFAFLCLIAAGLCTYGYVKEEDKQEEIKQARTVKIKKVRSKNVKRESGGGVNRKKTRVVQA